jgi:hypothetical protein
VKSGNYSEVTGSLQVHGLKKKALNSFTRPQAATQYVIT